MQIHITNKKFTFYFDNIILQISIDLFKLCAVKNDTYGLE